MRTSAGCHAVAIKPQRVKHRESGLPEVELPQAKPRGEALEAVNASKAATQRRPCKRESRAKCGSQSMLLQTTSAR
jgi:hypothetical protein